jgi:RNA polymerase sigma factor (sigma-70 family)
MSLGDQSINDQNKSTEPPGLTTIGQEVNHDDFSENDTRWADASFNLEQLKSREPHAWRELIKIFTRIAENYIRKSFTNSGDIQPLTFLDAEELTSTVIADLYSRIDKIKTLDHLEASFRTALKHRTIDRKRSMDAERRGSGEVLSAADPELLPGKHLSKNEADYKTKVEPYTNKALENDESTVVEGTQVILDQSNLEQEELRKIIFDCATELNEQERELLARIYNNEKHAEIAKALNIGTGSIGSRLKRIYEKLEPQIRARLGKQELEDYGIKTD